MCQLCGFAQREDKMILREEPEPSPQVKTINLDTVARWVKENPGVDVEHIADHFGMSYYEADVIVDFLLTLGMLDYSNET